MISARSGVASVCGGPTGTYRYEDLQLDGITIKILTRQRSQSVKTKSSPHRPAVNF